MTRRLWPSGNARVLHVIAPGPVGGAESVVLGLTAGLVEAGAEVVLAVLADASSGPFLARARAEGREIEVIDAPGRNYPRDWFELRRIVRKHNVDLVHSHGYRADMMGFLAARSERRPVVSTAHGFTDSGRKNRLNQWLGTWALQRDDAVIAVSSPLATRLASMGVPVGRIATIPNAWRPPKGPPIGRAEARIRLGIRGEKPLLGWVGRLSHVKGADIAIAALALTSNNPATLVFVGDGPERPALEAQAAALGITARVRFVGMVQDAASILPAFDTLVLSSRSEGTPMILLETIHAGVPIVASAVGGVPDLLPPEAALLVPPNDPAALAAAMDRALADPGAGAVRVKAAQERVAERFSPGEWVSRHLAVYQRVMERRFD